MRDVISLIIPSVLFGSWIFLEFKNNRLFRITLGLLNIFYCIFLIFIISSSSDMQLGTYRMAIREIEKRLDQGEIRKVKDALAAFDDRYKKTGSHKECSLALLNSLGND